MNETLTYFISDLHLSEDTLKLNSAFDQFIDYCLLSPPHKLFILGDLFDYYLGFDIAGIWGEALALKIKSLTDTGIMVYFLPGNRDFLIDKAFLKLSHMILLKDPTCFNFGQENMMLTHGDFLCMNDKKHQQFRRISQSTIVKFLFLSLPKKYRRQLALKVRHSGRKQNLSELMIEPVDKLIQSYLTKFNANIIVHGHTHRPMHKHKLTPTGEVYQHIVLPDWREYAEFVIYHSSNKSFEFSQLK